MTWPMTQKRLLLSDFNLSHIYILTKQGSDGERVFVTAYRDGGVIILNQPIGVNTTLTGRVPMTVGQLNDSGYELYDIHKAYGKTKEKITPIRKGQYLSIEKGGKVETFVVRQIDPEYIVSRYNSIMDNVSVVEWNLDELLKDGYSIVGVKTAERYKTVGSPYMSDVIDVKSGKTRARFYGPTGRDDAEKYCQTLKDREKT